MNKICYGCGAKLQSDDENKIGYVPSNLKDPKYCMRCFKMMNYGINNFNEIPKDTEEIIRKVNKDNIFVIFLIDLLNISDKVLDIFKSIKKDKLLVVNKCELMSTNITSDKLINILRNYYHINSDIRLKGGNNYHGARGILGYLREHDIHEAYVLGITNSGKSTFINDVSKILESNINKINVSSKSNTTYDFLRVKLNDDLTLIDSPGFVIDNCLFNEVSKDSIKEITFNMKDNEILSLLDNKYFIKVSNKTSLTIYHNLNGNKPFRKYYKDIPKLNNNINITSDNIDIIIYGFGFIRVKNACRIETNIPDDSIELRPSLFGGKYE